VRISPLGQAGGSQDTSTVSEFREAALMSSGEDGAKTNIKRLKIELRDPSTRDKMPFFVRGLVTFYRSSLTVFPLYV
jgi:hypothetical protein